MKGKSPPIRKKLHLRSYPCVFPTLQTVRRVFATTSTQMFSIESESLELQIRMQTCFQSALEKGVMEQQKHLKIKQIRLMSRHFE